jgi:hypothetical protein
VAEPPPVVHVCDPSAPLSLAILEADGLVAGTPAGRAGRLAAFLGREADCGVRSRATRDAESALNRAEWAASTDARRMAKAMLALDANARVLRHRNIQCRQREGILLAAGCARLEWAGLDERSRQGVRVGERFADGLATHDERQAAWQAASDVCDELHDAANDGPEQGKAFQRAVAAQVAARRGVMATLIAPRCGTRQQQAAVMRDIFGDPFSPPWRSHPCLRCRAMHGACRECNGWGYLLEPAGWAGEEARSLAHAAYWEGRDEATGRLDAARLGVLADCLEEAGCGRQDILAHLRGPGPHVRGCWAVDFVLWRRTGNPWEGRDDEPDAEREAERAEADDWQAEAWGG